MSKKSSPIEIRFLSSLLAVLLVSTYTSATSLAADDSQALYDAGPLNFPAAQLQTWVGEKENLQPQRSPRTTGGEPSANNPAAVRLLYEQHHHFASDGTTHVTSWEITKVTNKEGATAASRVDVVWSPWHKERPVLQARVINPDGKVITNDGKDAIEQAAASSETAVLTDSRQLTLVLHGVEVGSIIEIKTSYVERPEAGALFQRLAMTDLEAAKIHRLVITNDKDITLVHRCLGPELKPQVSQRPATGNDDEPAQKIIYQADFPQRIMDQVEVGCGPDLSSIPIIEFGTPQPWQELGKQYAQSVEKAIGEGNKLAVSMVKSIAEESKAWNTLQKVTWCDEQIRKALRYTSLAFGEQRIYPVSPDTMFARRFGDCKDHATLLVAMLREMGVISHVALVNAGTGLDVPKEAGAFSQFNHAITYIPEIDQWVDLTAQDYTVGLLHVRVQGRRALVCDEVGGRMLKTPTMSASQNQSHAVRTYDLNFSGGGHYTIGMAGSGLYGLGLRGDYEAAPADEMLDTWKKFFKQYYGAAEVTSLQRCAYGPDKYAIRAASDAIQLAARDEFMFVVPTDARNLLESLPAALQPMAFDSSGNAAQVRHRTYPLIINTGSLETLTYSLQIPAGLTASYKTKDWKEKFGTIEISMTIRENDISNLVNVPRDAQLKWEELVPKSQAAIYQWKSQCDREVRLQYAISIEPGEVSVEDANRCIEFLNTLRKLEGKLSCQVQFNWTVVEKFQERPTNELLKEIARQATRYHAFIDPRLALSLEMRRFHLNRFAQEAVADVQDIPAEYSLARQWLGLLRATDINGFQFSPLVDHHALREMFRGHELESFSVVRYVVLHCAVSDIKGLHTIDKESLEYAEKVLEKHRQDNDSAVSQDAAAVIENDHVYVLLALRRDEELKQLFRQSKLDRFNPIEALILGKDLKVPKSIPVAQRADHKRFAWEALMNAGRADLAQRLDRELWPEPKLKLVAEDEQLPKLVPLDRTNAESVARHVVRAILMYEVAELEGMLIDKAMAKQCVGGPLFAPIALNEWFTRTRSGRSPALIESICALTPTELTSVGKSGKVVTFKNPYQKTPFALWLVQESDGQWRASLADQYAFGSRLLQYCEAGESEEASKWLELIMPPLVRELPWFDNSRGSPAARAWMLKEDSRRVELTAHFLRAQNNDADLLDTWLAQHSVPELPANITTLIEGLHAIKWEEQGKFGPIFEVTLKMSAASRDPDMLHTAMRAARKMKNHSHEPFDIERVRAVLGKIVTAKSTDVVSKHLQVEFDFLADEPDKAYEKLEAMTQGKKVPTSALNEILWSSMVRNESCDVLKERIDKVIKLQPENAYEDAFYRHTLACAQATCGDPLAALEALAEIAHTEPDANDELLRGLILEQLEFPEAAKSAFELTIELEPYSACATIAQHHLGATK